MLLAAEPETVGAYEAKTHLPRLLDGVEQGQAYRITRHGRPVAYRLPVHASPPADPLVEDLLSLGRGRGPGPDPDELRRIIDEAAPGTGVAADAS